MFLLKKEYANYSNNKEICKSEYKKLDLKEDPHFGAACLIEIKNVTQKKWSKRKDGEEILIQDEGYKWLTLFPREENFAVIAIYDADSNFVQFTFNIGKKVKYKAKIPHLHDLYLDIVLTDTNEVEFTGEEELENAYKSKNIKQKDYELARKSADKVVNKFHKAEAFEELKQTAQKYLEAITNTVN